MCFYEILIQLSQHYACFEFESKIYGLTTSLKFDLRQRSIFSGEYFIMKEGCLVRDKIILSDGTIYLLDADNLIKKSNSPYVKLEQLFDLFYTSVPGQADAKFRGNFRGMDVNKMTLEQIEHGLPRVTARYALEGYILLSSVCGYIPWYNAKHFFWFSKKSKGLILYKNWIEGGNNEFDAGRNNQNDV